MKYSRLLFIIPLLLTTACHRKQAYIPMNKEILKSTEGKVYLVPLGDFPTDTTHDLARFYRNKYQLQVETLQSVPLPEGAMNPKRRQLIAEAAVEIMKQAHPELKNNPQAILIGLTNRDMYIAKYDWQFSFSWRDGGKYAVVSSGRMHLPNGRQLMTERVILRRLRKMVTKNVGILYYNLAPNDNPQSVLFRNVGGVRDLDSMGEDF